MKNIFKSLFILLITAGTLSAQVDRSIRPTSGEAPKPKIGNAEQFTLENGMKVFVVENHKLPRISVSMILNNDPVKEGEKAGYVSLAGDLLKQGTVNRTKAQLDEEIDFMGARLNASASSVSGAALSKYTDKLFELMSDVTLNPAWNEEEFAKLKTQMISGIKSNMDDAGAINSQVYNALLYGKDNAFGEFITEETLENVSIEDCKAYYNTYFKPNVAYMAIVGDISVKEAKKLVNKYFGSWEKGDVPAMEPYKIPEIEKTNIAFVNRDASVQSVIKIGNTIDLKPGSADIAPVSVANSILGGGMSGRLFINLREDKAFTYGAYSNFGTSKYISSFGMSAEVRNEVTDSAVIEFFNELEKIRTTIPTDKEMKMSKSLLSGDFGRSLESPGTIARFAINIDRYNLPKDYYQNYLARIEAVTKEDVQRVAQKYFSMNKALICITGKGADVAEGLNDLGGFQYYDMYGNKAKAPVSEVPEGVNATSIVNNYINALGGEKVLSKVKAYEMKLSAEMKGAPQALEMVEAADVKKGYYFNSVKMGTMVLEQTVYNGETATKSGMSGSSTLEGSDLDEVKDKASIAFEELNYLNTEKYTLNVAGMAKEGEGSYYILEVTDLATGNKASQYFDVNTGLKYKEVSVQVTPQGNMNLTAYYADYKEYNGIKVPGKITQKVGPQTIEMELIYYNPKQKFNKDYLK